MHTRTGVLDGKRVDYFKGELSLLICSKQAKLSRRSCQKGRSAVKALRSAAYTKAKIKNAPTLSTDEEAVALLNSMIPFSFYLRANRGDHMPPPPPGPGQAPQSTASQPRGLQIAQMQHFAQDEYFIWFLPPSQLKTVLGGIGMVAVILAAVMFPLWPVKLRIGVWYLSMAVLGLIGLFFAMAIVRLIFWLITIVVAKPGIWIFPKLFEDVGFVRRLVSIP